MLCLILIAALVAATSAQNCTTDYCTICEDHTLCLYPSSEFHSACSSPIYAGLLCGSDKQEILDVHNDRRRTVAKGLEIRGSPGPQPFAANMRKLVWDNELARIAQRWTNQCFTSAPPCSDVERFAVGQNHYATSSSPVNPEVPNNWTEAINSWYELVTVFNSNSVSPYVPGLVPEYTQVVWADTYTIGCGFTSYSRLDVYYRFYMCLYGPTGNIAGNGSSVYQVGQACTACPDGTRCDDGLCA